MSRSQDRNAGRDGRDLGTEVAVRLRGLRDAPTRRLRSMGFPYTSAPTPRGVEPPAQPQVLGDAYDTDWARRPIARWSRLAALATVGRGVVELTCRPRLLNADRIEDLDAPAVFVANHQSHLDTALLLSTLPRPWRHEMVVAAAADYFFDTRPKAALAAWAYGAVPMERRKVSRRSADRAAALIEDGWSLLIFPEGGRSPDGWGQDHKGGAAYLAVRCGVPVVPVHLDGTGRVLPKGRSRPAPETVTINIGTPLHAHDGEDARSVAPRIEAAIEALADESSSDWYSARRRAHAAATPSLKGPDTDTWRRDWTNPDRRPRPRDEDRWPDLGGR
jgi:1-acyl-sn-glycerol-3-phosphate acyltransferase